MANVTLGIRFPYLFGTLEIWQISKVYLDQNRFSTKSVLEITPMSLCSEKTGAWLMPVLANSCATYYTRRFGLMTISGLVVISTMGTLAGSSRLANTLFTKSL